jgi:hypothetical protein
MGWNDHIDWLLKEEIQDLVAEGVLEEGTPAYGIAHRVFGDRDAESSTIHCAA